MTRWQRLLEPRSIRDSTASLATLAHMDTSTTLPSPVTTRLGRIAAGAVLLALALVLVAGMVATPSAQAAEQRDRIQLVERPRDALALVLYGSLGLIAVGGVATLRRQLKGEREQTDGEFRWR
jgi:hypothetical protein